MLSRQATFALAIAFCAASHGFLGPASVPNMRSDDFCSEASCSLSSSNSSDMNPLYLTIPVHSPPVGDDGIFKLQSMFDGRLETPLTKFLCPSSWVVDVQEDRIPRALMVAKCQRDAVTKPLSKGLSCVEISYTLPVLRMEFCSSGFAAYREDFENITVACLPSRFSMEPLVSKIMVPTGKSLRVIYPEPYDIQPELGIH